MPGFIKRRLSNLTAQSTIEYAVVTACVVMALVSMQFYVKRSIAGRMKQAGDEIGEAYEPKNVDADINTDYISDVIVNQELVPLKDASGSPLKDRYDQPVYGIKSTAEIYENTERGGHENLGAFEDKLF